MCLGDVDRIVARVGVKDLVQTNFGNEISECSAGNRVFGLRRTLGAGPTPFRVRSGYRWVSPEGITSQLQSVVIDHAARLMELAMEVDDIALILRATSIASCVIDDPMVELPIRNVEKHYVDATGSPELAQSVLAAKHRFMEYVDTEDALAEG